MKMNQKYSKMDMNDRNLRDMTVETANRFAEIGFKVELVMDNETGNFTFDIVGRIQKHDFDIEEKIWEVKKAKEKEEILPEL